jgi:ABC-2 type transport system ATP-binding protein
MSKAIQVEHLKKSYGSVVAVEDVSFEVETGEIFGIIGRNGAGKTTTVECLQGLRRYDSGLVRILGLDPQTQSKAVRSQVGSQLQSSALPDRIKVWEALDFFSTLAPQATDWRPLLEQWGIADKRNESFANLSGGQRQRLFVALALVGDPEIVFLDEMTQGLDPAGRLVAWDLIRALRTGGKTVFLVTHYMDEAEALCDRVAVIEGGHVAAIGTPDRLIAAHGGATRLIFSSASDDMVWLQRVPNVIRVERNNGKLIVTGSGSVLLHASAALLERGLEPADLRVEQPTLADVFLALTGGS